MCLPLNCRKDAQQLECLLHSPEAQLVLLHKYSGLLAKSETNSAKWKAVTVPARDVPDNSFDQRVGRIFLGLDEHKRPFFAASVTQEAAANVADLQEQVGTAVVDDYLNPLSLKGFLSCQLCVLSREPIISSLIVSRIDISRSSHL